MSNVDLAHVGAVDQDCALAWVIEPCDQRDQTCLARARGADQGDGLAGFDLARSDVAKRRRGAVVAQGHARNSTSPPPAGSAGAPGGLWIAGSRSRISNIRLPEATARCAIPIETPSIRIGPASIPR